MFETQSSQVHFSRIGSIKSSDAFESFVANRKDKTRETSHRTLFLRSFAFSRCHRLNRMHAVVSRRVRPSLSLLLVQRLFRSHRKIASHGQQLLYVKKSFSRSMRATGISWFRTKTNKLVHSQGIDHTSRAKKRPPTPIIDVMILHSLSRSLLSLLLLCVNNLHSHIMKKREKSDEEEKNRSLFLLLQF